MKFFKLSILYFLLLTSVSSTIIYLTGCKTSSFTGKSSMPVIELDTMEITISRNNTYRSAENRVNDLLHVALSVTPDYSNSTLKGKATLLFKPYFYPTDTLILDAKHFNFETVALISANDTIPLDFTYEDSLQCRIRLNRPHSSLEQYVVYIEYTANPNTFSGGSAAITEDKGLYFINPTGTDSTRPTQIWTQGETESASCWFPCIDRPNERATQEMWITHDKKYQSLSNGLLINSKEINDSTVVDYWKMDLPHAPYLFMMVIGSFDITRERWRNIPVEYWIDPKFKRSVKSVFGSTPEMMDFFSRKLGYNYPWPKYTSVVVYDYVSGAMENTSASLFGDFMQRTNRELLDENNEDIVAHELFHQWFGDLVTCESWSNLPLNESFATYGEYLWNEYKHGKPYADMRLRDYMFKYLDEAENSPKQLIRYKYESREDMFDAHSYEKGGHVLHMLRHEIGDEAFFKSLNRYLQKMQFSSAEIHDLRLTFEEVCGRDLQTFFNQWFFTKGHPVLDISSSYTSNKVEVVVKQKQEPDEGLVYHLNTIFTILTTDTLYQIPVKLSKSENRFIFEVKGKVLYSDLDPERVLLAVRNDVKTPGEWMQVLRHSVSYSAKVEALEKLYESKVSFSEYAPAVQLALSDSFYGIRAAAIAGMESGKIDSLTEQKVRVLALNDLKSDVRTEAVLLLGDTPKENNKDLFLKALNDSSYRVVAAALEALADIDLSEALRIADQYRNESNFDITEAVAHVLTIQGSPNDVSWFTSRMNQPKSASEKYILPGALIRLLVHFPLPQAKETITYLKEWFESGKAPYKLSYTNLINRADLASSGLLKSDHPAEKNSVVQTNAKQLKTWLESEKKRLKK